jgi:Carboxypeptidase regulatory-like domain
MMRFRFPLALAAVAVLAGCGGAHTASIQVGVSATNGQPLAGAQVWVDGSEQRELTDSTGNATLTGLKVGIYQVEAGIDGYFRERKSVTVQSKADPAPISISLPYAPPFGTFVWQPKSTEWVTLSITAYNPFQAALNIYEWGCWSNGWNQHAPQQVQLDTSTNTLTFSYGKTISIVGPHRLNAAWTRSVDGSGLPDTTSTVEPEGACNGSAAAWDSGNSP